MIVEPLICSGVSNPRFNLTEEEAREVLVLRRVSASLNRSSEFPSPRLGYNGLLVLLQGDVNSPPEPFWALHVFKGTIEEFTEEGTVCLYEDVFDLEGFLLEDCLSKYLPQIYRAVSKLRVS